MGRLHPGVFDPDNFVGEDLFSFTTTSYEGLRARLYVHYWSSYSQWYSNYTESGGRVNSRKLLIGPLIELSG
jgi:hypothetical protein